MVGIVAVLGREVEGDREPRLAPREEEVETPVRRLGASESGVLTQRPESPTVHGGLNAPGVRVRPRVADLLEEIGVGIVGRVDQQRKLAPFDLVADRLSGVVLPALAPAGIVRVSPSACHRRRAGTVYQALSRRPTSGNNAVRSTSAHATGTGTPRSVRIDGWISPISATGSPAIRARAARPGTVPGISIGSRTGRMSTRRKR